MSRNAPENKSTPVTCCMGVHWLLMMIGGEAAISSDLNPRVSPIPTIPPHDP